MYPPSEVCCASLTTTPFCKEKVSANPVPVDVVVVDVVVLW